MPFTQAKCASCGKTSVVTKEFKIGKKIALALKCGHLIIQDTIDESDPSSFTSIDGKRAYPFQVQGVKFLEQANGRGAIIDEMGLGKTVQVCLFFRAHKEVLPALYVLKASLLQQWSHEIMRWQGENEFAQIITDSRTHFIPGLRHYLISYDMIPRFSKCPYCNHEAHGNGVKDDMTWDSLSAGKTRSCSHRSKRKQELDCDCQHDSSARPDFLSNKLKELGIKTIVLDECQQIKNTDADRTREIRKLCAGEQIEHVIALSGTPILNNASEYFSILNILHPEIFPTYTKFIQNDCDAYHDGYKWKVGGLANPESFKRKTERFIIRRERKDVMPDLPAITRNFQFCDLGAEVEKAYANAFAGFVEATEDTSLGAIAKAANILAYLSKMRHLTGLSKIEPAVDFTMDFLLGTERKIVLFIHHKDVGEIVLLKLQRAMKDIGMSFEPLSLTADLSSDGRQAVVAKFMGPSHRVLVASTLASGEGLNLQKCSDCIMLERQWNPAKEEQAEGRFIRIGQLADAVTATYLICVGTVDEFFSKIVERKRQDVTNTLGGEAIPWDESSLMRELTETLASLGRDAWKL